MPQVGGAAKPDKRFLLRGLIGCSRVEKLSQLAHRLGIACLGRLPQLTFCKRLIKIRNLPGNPFEHLEKLNAAEDPQHRRRTLSEREFARLIAAAERGEPFRGVSGFDRAMLYRLAAYTGLRESELASLRAASFNLESEPPTVRVPAARTQSGQEAVIPIETTLAGQLREWFAKLSLRMHHREGGLLWPGTWKLKGARMMRRDLEAAELLYWNTSGLVFDFHALRGQFITSLDRRGVSLVAAQKLARHSNPKLTSNFYSRLQLLDLAGEVNKLRPSPAVGGTESEERLRSTGTGGSTVTLAAQNSGRCSDSYGTDERDSDRPGNGGKTQKPLK